MKTIVINDVKVAYKVDYYLNSADVTIYVKHRIGQIVISNKTKFTNYRDYSRCTISVSTIDCKNEVDVVMKATKDMKISTCIKLCDPADKMFIKEIFKALE